MKTWSVTELNNYISDTFDENETFSGIFVKGELSNISFSKGHMYFTLKDEKSSISAVMFKGNNSKLKFEPKTGMSVILMGKICVYVPYGKCQIQAYDMLPEGVGSVQIALEQLKEKLQKLGMFDISAKKKLPYMPKKIGVVTSSKGAALQDIINILSRRYPLAELIVSPTLVQGEQAPESIKQAFIKLESFNPDVVILARGGGSAEDLAAFNTETVAYAVYNCKVPVISAVGHETDTSIADMVADLRVPTPSAAAEIVSVSVEQLKNDVELCTEKLKKVLNDKFEYNTLQFENINEKLLRFSPEKKIENDIQKLNLITQKLKSTFNKIISEKENQYISVISKVEALNPDKVLDRGYSMVYHNGNVITKSTDLNNGDYIEIRMSDGTVRAKIVVCEED